MTLNYVTLTLDLYDAQGNPAIAGTATFTPSAVLTDAGVEIADQQPIVAVFHAAALPTVKLLATDNSGPLPAGWTWSVAFSGRTGAPSSFSFFLPYTGGSSQLLSNLIPVSSGTTFQAYVPLSSVGAASGVEGLDAAQRIVTPVGSFLLPAPPPVSRRAAYRAAAWSQIFQSGHGWTAGGGGTGSSNVNDTSTFIRGTQCASVTTAANGVQSNISNTAVSPPSLAGKMIRLVFKVDSVTHLSHMAFYLGTSNFSNFFQWTFHTHSSTAGQQNWVQSGEWVTVDLQWDSVSTASGSFSLSSHGVPSVQTGFTCMRVAAYDDGAAAITWHLQAVEIVADTTATFPGGVVSVTFDDSYQNVFTYGRPAMDTYGYRGTLFTIQDLVAASNGSTYLTVSQLQQLASASGWDVQGHAYTDANHAAGYNTLTALQVQDEMRYLRAWMLSNGFAGDIFAYPHGWFGNTSDNVPIEQIAQQYWGAARCIVEEVSEVGPAAPMPFRLRSITGINDGTALGGTTVANLIATGGPLDKCAANGSWLILTFHQIITGTPSDSTMCTQTGFTSVMSAINSLGIPVLPVADVIRYYS